MSIPFPFNPLGLSGGNVDDTPLTLTFQDSGYFSFIKRNSNDVSGVDLQYNRNNQGWIPLNISASYHDQIYVDGGDVVQIQNFTNQFSNQYYYPIRLESSCYFDVSGNIMSLVNFGELHKNCFRYLFENCAIWDASKLTLPATTLAESCYEYMFNECQTMAYAPAILPATKLANSCYNNMFSYCYNLISAPVIMAVDDADVSNAMSYMFEYCQSLQELKIHLQYIFDYNNFASWVNGVSDNGDFYLPSNSDASSIKPSYWNMHYF